MKKLILFLLVCSIYLNVFPIHIFVSKQATGNNDGSSWEHAFTRLEDALTASLNGDSIFIAQGTYTPTNPSVNGAYLLKKGVAIFGGFNGIELITPQVIAKRDFHSNKTILSADINQNDNTNVSTNEATRSDNAIRVFYYNASDTLSVSTILDGLILSGGNADGRYHSGQPSSASARGGAMYISANVIRIILRNLVIENNSAKGGGGIFFTTSATGKIEPNLENVVFSGNVADNYSAGTDNIYGGAIYINCNGTSASVNASFLTVRFENNLARGYRGMGGAIYAIPQGSNVRADFQFDECQFSNNQAIGTTSNAFGGAFWMEVRNGAEGFPVFRNTSFCQNKATGLSGSLKGFGGAGHFTEGLNGTGKLEPQFINVTVTQNTANGDASAFYIEGSNNKVSFLNTIIYNNSIVVNTNGSFTQSHSLINSVDPLFVDPQGCDLRLRMNSPALGAGDGINGLNAGAYQGEAIDIPFLNFDNSEINMGKAVSGSITSQFTFIFGASNIKDKLKIIAPEHVEISMTSLDYSENTKEITLTPVNGNISNTYLYLRFRPMETGEYSGKIIFEADGYTREKPLRGESILSKTVFVKKDASGANNGTSWVNAYTNLHDAILNSMPGDSILIAKGQYTPKPGNQFNKFSLDGHVLVGGFEGTEHPITPQTIANRSIYENETIISGDIDGDGTTSGNSLEIFYISGFNKTVLDGLVIQDCRNYISNADYAAVRIFKGSAILQNMRIKNNMGYKTSGAISVLNGVASLDRVILNGNKVIGSVDSCLGGGIYAKNSIVNIYNSLIYSNSVEKTINAVGFYAQGGGIYSTNSHVHMINTTLSNNHYNNLGPKLDDQVYMNGDTLNAVNCIFDKGAIFGKNNGKSRLSYSFYHGNLNNAVIDEGNNVFSDQTQQGLKSPSFVDAVNGDYRLTEKSPCLGTGNSVHGPNIGWYQGEGLPAPGISFSPSPLVFGQTIVNTGKIKGFDIWGRDLSQNLTLTVSVPENLEISLDSANFSPNSSLNLLLDGDKVNSTRVFVKFKPFFVQDYNNLYIVLQSTPYLEYLFIVGKGVNEITGISTPGHIKMIFPNPAKDRLFLMNQDPITGIRAVDMHGNAYNFPSTNEQSGSSINISHLKPGIYLFVIETVQGEIIKEKVIIQ